MLKFLPHTRQLASQPAGQHNIGHNIDSHSLMWVKKGMGMKQRKAERKPAINKSSDSSWSTLHILYHAKNVQEQENGWSKLQAHISLTRQRTGALIVQVIKMKVGISWPAVGMCMWLWVFCYCSVMVNWHICLIGIFLWHLLHSLSSTFQGSGGRQHTVLKHQASQMLVQLGTTLNGLLQQKTARCQHVWCRSVWPGKAEWLVN